MKEDIKILLNRRDEIKKEINKLNEEYTALGNLINKFFNKEKIIQKQQALKNIYLQIKEQTRNGRTTVLLNPNELRQIGYIIPRR